MLRLIALLVSLSMISCFQTKNNKKDIIKNTSSYCILENVPVIDSTKLKLSSVKNLDLYNGIKNIKFGTIKSNYANCIKCTNYQTLDTCVYSDSFTFFDQKWKLLLFFENDTLSRIKLLSKSNFIPNIYPQLSSIFGSPNGHILKLINRSELKRNTYSIRSLTKSMHKSYSENPNNFISNIKFSNAQFENYNYKTLREQIEENPNENKNIYYKDFETKEVSIKYYPSLNSFASWNSTVILNMTISKTTSLKVVSELNKSEENNNAGLYLYGGYELENKYDLVIEIYRNIKTLSHFKELEMLKNKRNQENLKNSAKKKMELLNKF